MNSATLLLFAKFPSPGAVKTRLIPLLGPAGATNLAEAFLLDLTLRLARADFPSGLRRVICFDPPGAAAQFAALLAPHPEITKSFSLQPQSAGGLGRRLAAALRENAPHGPVLFIGADAPDLPLDEITAIFTHAAAGRAYLQHASDGGYVLLALPQSAPPEVFSDIEWSSPQTGAQQAERIRARGIPIVESAQRWPDVDAPADLAPLKARLSANPGVAPRTLQVLCKFESKGRVDAH